MGRYILTGSQQFELSHHIAQSLAGRTALLRLLPFSLAELKRADACMDTDARSLPAAIRESTPTDSTRPLPWVTYFETYVQRDLRELIEIRIWPCSRNGLPQDVSGNFEHAGLAPMSAFGAYGRRLGFDSGSMYIVFRLPPWFENIGKRWSNRKLYFYDTGLAAWLMGITRREHLMAHPLRGNLENLAVLEFLISRTKGTPHEVKNGRQLSSALSNPRKARPRRLAMAALGERISGATWFRRK